MFINETIRETPQACSIFLHHWMALLPLSRLSLHYCLPPSLYFSLALSLRLRILCRRKINIAREHNEDYQIDIGDNLFLPSLLHGLFLHFPLLSASVTHSLPVVNLCFHPLPFKSLIASGHIRETERERRGGGWTDKTGIPKYCKEKERHSCETKMRDLVFFLTIDTIDLP